VGCRRTTDQCREGAAAGGGSEGGREREGGVEGLDEVMDWGGLEGERQEEEEDGQEKRGRDDK